MASGPPVVEWSHWTTLTLWSGADSNLPLEPLQRFPNGLATPMDLERRLPKPPGQEWHLAPSRCCMVTLGDTVPLKWRGLSNNPSVTQLDRDVAYAQPRSIRDFVDTLIERQAKNIDAAIQSQTAVNCKST